MKKSPSRKQIETVLEQVIVKALKERLELVEDATTLTRTFRALVGIGLDFMLAGDAPNEVIAVQLDRVLSKKLSKRKAVKKQPLLLMKPAKA
jgi:hypothetical protein